MTDPRQPRETTSDDSTMFSLQALVRDHPQDPSPASEDSGLIDLATLRSVAASDPIAQGAAPDLFGVPPSPAAPRPLSAGPPPVPRRDRYLAAGLWAAVVLLSAAIAGKLYPSSPTAASAPAVTVSEPAPPPTDPVSAGPEAAQPATAEPPRAVAETGPAEPSSANPEPAVAERSTPSPVVHRKSPPPTTKTPPAANPAKPPKTASPGCVCPPKDLTCHMRCATAG
jgi:hypothetical protein